MDKILTLCEKCRAEFDGAYKVRRLTDATTELKKACENCGMKGSPYVLSRYLIYGKKPKGAKGAI